MESKRLMWADYLVEEEGKLYGPPHFQKILRDQQINPYHLDVAFHDLEKLYAMLKEYPRNEFDYDYLREFMEDLTDLDANLEISPEIKTKIAQTMNIPNTPENGELITKMILVYAVYFVGGYISEDTNDVEQKILANELSRAQISWGTQHALWHIMDKGTNTEIGETLYDEAQDQLDNMADW